MFVPAGEGAIMRADRTVPGAALHQWGSIASLKEA